MQEASAGFRSHRTQLLIHSITSLSRSSKSLGVTIILLWHLAGLLIGPPKRLETERLFPLHIIKLFSWCYNYISPAFIRIFFSVSPSSKLLSNTLAARDIFQFRIRCFCLRFFNINSTVQQFKIFHYCMCTRQCFNK